MLELWWLPGGHRHWEPGWAHTAGIPTAARGQTSHPLPVWVGLETAFPRRLVTNKFLGIIPTFLELPGVLEESPPDPALAVEVREAAELPHSLGNVCEGEGRECSTPEIKGVCST